MRNILFYDAKYSTVKFYFLSTDMNIVSLYVY